MEADVQRIVYISTARKTLDDAAFRNILQTSELPGCWWQEVGGSFKRLKGQMKRSHNYFAVSSTTRDISPS